MSELLPVLPISSTPTHWHLPQNQTLTALSSFRLEFSSRARMGQYFSAVRVPLMDESLSHLLNTESRWRRLCILLDENEKWKSLASHLEVNENDKAPYYDPEFWSESRKYVGRWVSKPNSTTAKFIDVLKKLQFNDIVELIVSWIEEDSKRPKNEDIVMECRLPGQDFFEQGMELYWDSRFHSSREYFKKAAQLKHPLGFLRLVITATFFQSTKTTEFQELVEQCKQYKERYIKQAQSGDPVCQFNLGYYFEFVENDEEKKMEWYRKSSEQGYAPAQGKLAFHYYTSYKDYPKCFYWMERSALQGFAASQRNVGLFYEQGQVVPKDYAEALKWYTRSAVQGFSFGFQSLGASYRIGKIVPQDYAQAVHYYQKAVEKEDPESMSHLAWFYETGKSVDKDVEMALKLYHRATEQGLNYAFYRIGLLYDMGFGIPQDYKLGAHWYKLSAQRGYATGQVCLANMYMEGRGRKQNTGKGIYWYKQAAIQDISACCTLGSFYLEGNHVARDYKEAMYWYQKAAQKGSNPACCALAKMYCLGQGAPQDYHKAIHWLEKAANLNDPQAQYQLGLCYEWTSDGTLHNHILAMQWLRKSSLEQAREAADFLELMHTMQKEHKQEC